MLPNEIQNNTITDADKVMENFNNLDGRLEDVEAAWSTWTPVFTNLTIGNGTVTAKYIQIGKTVHCRLTIVFGSTTSISGPINLSLPVTSANYGGSSLSSIGNGLAFELGVSARQISWLSNGAVGAYNAALTYAGFADVNTNIPFIWGTGDQLYITGTYEAA